MQNTFKVGDKIKVVKFSAKPPERYFKYLGQEFTVADTAVDRTFTIDPEDSCRYLCFFNNEIEPVKDEPAPKENHAWAVVNKATGKVEWIRQTRRVARKLAKFQNETSTQLYQVKKIEYNFV